MIQRVQSLYLLLSAALGVVCLCRPVGHFLSGDSLFSATLYNLWVSTSEGSHSFSPWALFALLVIACALTFLNIFLFRYRALQMRVTSLCMILLAGYYAYYAFQVWAHTVEPLSFRPTVAAALPFVCIILDFLAFRATLKDELLIRSLDRLR